MDKEPGLSSEVASKLRSLLTETGYSPEYSLSEISRGGNNAVFKLTTGETNLLFKLYFRHSSDKRDRLRQEFSFLEFCNQNKIAAVPQAIFKSEVDGFGVYEFIEGRKLAPGEITPQFIDEALEFVSALNAVRHSSNTHLLSNASDSCFSLQQNIQAVQRRLGLFTDNHIDIEPSAGDLIENELLPAWDALVLETEELAGTYAIQLDKELAPEERSISPSDFGFHNAILEANGKLRFIDFEYAGWDDPAKLTADFFGNAGLAVSDNHLPHFASYMQNLFPNDRELRKRIALLLPIHHIKWCLIILNEFNPLGKLRAQFLESQTVNLLAKKESQLIKARNSLSCLKSKKDLRARLLSA